MWDKRPHPHEFSQKMKEIACDASNYPTNLWFLDVESSKDSEHPEQITKKKQLDDLISCGQFTMCHRLLGAIEKIPKDQLSCDLKVTYERVLTAWNEFFVKNPECLVGDSRQQMIKDWNQRVSDNTVIRG